MILSLRAPTLRSEMCLRPDVVGNGRFVHFLLRQLPNEPLYATAKLRVEVLALPLVVVLLLPFSKVVLIDELLCRLQELVELPCCVGHLRRNGLHQLEIGAKVFGHTRTAAARGSPSRGCFLLINCGFSNFHKGVCASFSISAEMTAQIQKNSRCAHAATVTLRMAARTREIRCCTASTDMPRSWATSVVQY